MFFGSFVREEGERNRSPIVIRIILVCVDFVPDVPLGTCKCKGIYKPRRYVGEKVRQGNGKYGRLFSVSYFSPIVLCQVEPISLTIADYS